MENFGSNAEEVHIVPENQNSVVNKVQDNEKI